MSEALTGGCQCGAVRFRAGRLGRGSLCHCRMCQKQFGHFYAPFVTSFEVTWTRGQPKWFRSSNLAERGFCADCGTPLVYHELGGEYELAIGAFDNPVAAAPVIQVNPADKLPFADDLPELPTRMPGDSPKQDAFNARVVSYQHPDHDTAVWPVEQQP
ncbi:MAG TPA: GFA family protein [Bauldia sp.]|nr:GFA family protein [Bauldia sp.]